MVQSVSFNNPTSQLSNGSIAAEAGRMTGDSEKDMLVRSLVHCICTTG